MERSSGAWRPLAVQGNVLLLGNEDASQLEPRHTKCKCDVTGHCAITFRKGDKSYNKRSGPAAAGSAGLTVRGVVCAAVLMSSLVLCPRNLKLIKVYVNK